MDEVNEVEVPGVGGWLIPTTFDHHDIREYLRLDVIDVHEARKLLGLSPREW